MRFNFKVGDCTNWFRQKAEIMNVCKTRQKWQNTLIDLRLGIEHKNYLIFTIKFAMTSHCTNTFQIHNSTSKVNGSVLQSSCDYHDMTKFMCLISRVMVDFSPFFQRNHQVCIVAFGVSCHVPIELHLRLNEDAVVAHALSTSFNISFDLDRNWWQQNEILLTRMQFKIVAKHHVRFLPSVWLTTESQKSWLDSILRGFCTTKRVKEECARLKVRSESKCNTFWL